MDPKITKITIVTMGNTATVTQIQKQLKKLVDVIKVFDLTEGKYIDRELVLVKVCASPKNRSALIELAALFHAENVLVQNKAVIIQVAGTTDAVDNFLELIKPHGIVEVSRTGVIAVGKVEG